MDESNSDALADAAAPPPVTAEEPQQQAVAEAEQQQQEEGEEDEEDEEKNEEDELIEKAQKLMEKITCAPDNPNPAVLHALSCILETQESLYMEEHDKSSFNNNRSSHLVGRLGNLVRENDDFFELISSKFLSESRYSTSVQAASSRLLLSCSLTWTYPHVFEDDVLENVRNWVLEDTPRTTEEHNLKHGLESKGASDFEMLKTYSTGLLAICLTGSGQLLEDVLTSGLPSKLMRYLRIRILGESSTSQKNASHTMEHRATSGTPSVRGREEGRSRVRQVLETTHLDDSRMVDGRSIDDLTVERNHEGSIGQLGDEGWVDGGEPPEGLAEGADTFGLNAEGEEKLHGRDLRDVKTKPGDPDELGREDLSRRRGSRGLARSRGKGWSEGTGENEQVLTSPGSGNRQGQGRVTKDRGVLKNLDLKKGPDGGKYSGKNFSDVLELEKADDEDYSQECRIGGKDISDLVKKAVRAAKAEARAAKAPAEAVKAAADAAAEVVKSAALEEFKATNDDEAAVLAASKAAATVVDAANATEAFSCRNSNHLNTDSVTEGPAGDRKEDTEEYFILDSESLAQLREKYCIQCLEVLGEYVEVLGPVLHEKGVDVCLALLHRSSEQDGLKTMLLPDVTKLICALAAHRKFSALFVDRGGMQKLLAVPRTAQTFFGLSSCLFAIGSLQGIMERVCALPADVIHQIVELAIVLIECSQDQARKNAALFFAAAFVFRAVIDGFDAQDGLQKLLGLLNDAASVRSGVNSLALAASGSLRNDRSTAEVLTSSEKQIAYHTCVALRQYFRAHLLLLVDSVRPNKNNRSFGRNIPSVRAANKPLDISNEAMDAVFLQLQKDRKLGPAFVRTRWPAVDKFLNSNGHIIMLELCQAPPVERYLHDLLQYALGVLHIVTLVPYSRKPILSTTLSNNRVGIAIVLDAANIASNYVDPEIIQPALNVLINLVCPPPSISNKPSSLGQGESNVERSGTAVHGAQSVHNTPQTAPATPASGLVGDRRITLGTGAGSAGLAAQLEQGYRQAREAVRANNGIKVLLHLLQPRAYSPPAALDCIRALTCRVLLGLARDDTIAHILTKLQVGKKLSELIRDSGSQTPGSEQSRWQSELSQVAIELIAIVTNSGRASTSAASDAATPTLRRIERAAIAAATPISYHSKELLQLIHEHLQASGLTDSAAILLKEAKLTPLPSLAAPSSLAHQVTSQDLPSVQLQWPAGRSACGFLTDEPDISAREGDLSLKGDASVLSLKKKSLAFSPILGLQSVKNFGAPRQTPAPASSTKAQPELTANPIVDAESNCKTPIILPLKRKLSELKTAGFSSSGKRRCTVEQGLRTPICPTPGTLRKSALSTEVTGLSTPGLNFRDQYGLSTPNICLPDNLDENQTSNFHAGLMTPSSQVGALNDHAQSSNGERLTLDTLVVQYLKHQHRQCPAPITTLPPLSLLQPHVCPEPKRSLEAPSNITARLGTREFRSIYSGMHGNRRDRQFVYSRFRPWRTCRDDINPLLTCMAFLGVSSHIAVGTHSGELRIFDTNNNSVLESCASHQSPVTIVQSCLSSESQLLLSSSYQDVLLWDATSISGGPMHTFEGCKAGRFGNSGNIFAALSSEPMQREICLYDIPTCHLELKLSDTDGSSNARGHLYSPVHFSPSDTMLLWNGVLWDRRVSGPVHRFDQFTDYGGGGFHPAGNEVIINSEVWDLRKFRLLRSVPSLDQTAITFNAHGDVIYAILRRNHEDVMSVVHPRRAKHPLFAAFRTVDAVTYSDIATVPVDRCVLDFATEPTDSFVGLVTLDDQDEMFSSARIYETGRRRPTDDDSDPDDAESEEDEEDDEDDGDIDPVLDTELGDGDSDGEDMSNEEDDDDSANDLDDDEGDFIMNDIDFDGGGGILEIVTDGEHDDDDDSDLVGGFSSSGDDEDYVGNDFGY